MLTNCAIRDILHLYCDLIAEFPALQSATQCDDQSIRRIDGLAGRSINRSIDLALSHLDWWTDQSIREVKSINLQSTRAKNTNQSISPHS